jgi:hypothetical protein
MDKRCELYKKADAAISNIIYDITHSPGGYAYWYNLPLKGRKSRDVLTENWIEDTLETLFPQELQKGMLQASLSPDGRTDFRGSMVYQWLLENIYFKKAPRLFQEWLVYFKPPSL